MKTFLQILFFLLSTRMSWVSHIAHMKNEKSITSELVSLIRERTTWDTQTEVAGYFKLSGFQSMRELYLQSNSRLSAKLVPTLVDRGMLNGQRGWSLQLWSRLSRHEPLLFLSSSSSIVLTRLSGPHPDPLLLWKSGSARNQTQTSGFCSQELWPLDHRDGR
jgi:hypothetical protein